MKRLVMGCAVVGMIALSPKTEAKLAVLPTPFPKLHRAIQKVHPVKRKGEVGWASWYGAEFQGRTTASGELFDPARLTAAHRRLPFGTLVRVTNLKNLASVLLRITDRGPATRGRVIDVSQAAAKQLGFLEAGLTRVEIDVVSYPRGLTKQPTHAPSSKAN